MDEGTARRVMGAAPGASSDELRRTYRALVRANHPDVGGDGRRTAEIVEAYRVLRALAPAPARPGRDGALLVAAAGAEAFLAVLDAAHRVGPVTYVDRESGLVEVVVDGCSLFLTLDERADGGTTVLATIEPLGDPDGPCPAIDDVLARLAG